MTVDPQDAVTGSEPINRFSIRISRRTMIKSMVSAAAAGGVLALGRGNWKSSPALQLDANTPPVKAYTLAGTDGWVSMPVGANAMPPYFPDSLAPANGNHTTDLRKDLFTTYAFGFRNVTAYNPQLSPTSRFLVDNVKNHVQISAPLIYAQAGQDLRLTLFNLGMGNRPDLFDSHTIHFHGFANQIAYFDGVPDASLSVPPGQSLHYRYLPVDAGTYMYHCHVEDVEHVQMGMNGMVFIAPRKGLNYAYDTAGDATTPNEQSSRFDRQFSIHLSEIFPQGHFGDAHIQDTDWTDFTGYFRLMNGRAWPDTIAPHAGDYPTGAPGDPDAALIGTGDALVDATRLRYQPLSSLIQGEAGEYLLVRVSHLGYEQHSLVLPGLPMTIIGQDAKFLGAGRDGYYPDYQYAQNDPLKPQRVPDAPRGNVQTQTNRVDIGPGESRDLLIGPLPAVTQKTVFPFYDREFGYLNGPDTTAGYGGMRTEVHVYPAGGLQRPTAAELDQLTSGPDAKTLDLQGNSVSNFIGSGAAVKYRDGSDIRQTFPGKLYQAK
ncbi:multicopper oxidase domain-containing protein [Jatrophihabitans telluris]|uniref:Multicopper oxidase domain-containing protein n=1 Tax=Jatrophihabitans telluris TaxID=2038343 RepID=A0ABY4QTM6_9ACTN|nr:multicopper oxidase domain-containing protein [Jatrophihabitans telluris]UQX87018.1 multicopper oxidase domain-containing protein [Jatrophihabitans telluris]